jgi:hypothetical protein
MPHSLVEVSEETAPSIVTPHLYTEKKSGIFLPDYTASHPKDHNLNSQPLFLIVSDTSDSKVSFRVWLLPLSFNNCQLSQCYPVILLLFSQHISAPESNF